MFSWWVETQRNGKKENTDKTKAEICRQTHMTVRTNEHMPRNTQFSWFNAQVEKSPSLQITNWIEIRNRIKSRSRQPHAAVPYLSLFDKTKKQNTKRSSTKSNLFLRFTWRVSEWEEKNRKKPMYTHRNRHHRKGGRHTLTNIRNHIDRLDTTKT